MVIASCLSSNWEQTMTIARKVKGAGAVLFRGGAFKPRTSPYYFQGLGEEGLKILAQVREETGLRIATEMTSPNQVDLMMKYADVVPDRRPQHAKLRLSQRWPHWQARLTQTGPLSHHRGGQMSADTFFPRGTSRLFSVNVVFVPLSLTPEIPLDLFRHPYNQKPLPAVPSIPSHVSGLREKVSPMARAAIAAGADGLMIEVHHDPSKAPNRAPESLPGTV